MRAPAATAGFLALLTASTAPAESGSASLYQPDDATADAVIAEALPAFGDPGEWWWQYGGGGGSSVNNGDYSVMAFGGASYFLARDFELSLDLTVWYLGEDHEDGDDAVALNVNPKFRWHFINEADFSLFAEAGVGLLVASEEAPEGGSEFNFTPQAGAGATFALSDDTAERLIVGVNWRHISNANSFGSDRNPGRDDVVVYVGVMVPF